LPLKTPDSFFEKRRFLLLWHYHCFGIITQSEEILQTKEEAMHRKEAGFTIVELMTVVAIVGILATIAGYSIATSMPDYRLREGSRELSSILQLARLRAINSNTRCYVDFAVGSCSADDRFYTVYLDRNDNREFDAGEDVAARIGMASANEPEFSDVKSKFPVGLTGGFRLPPGGSFGHTGPTTSPTGNPLPGDGISFNGEKASFNHRGSGAGGTIYLENGRNTRAVSVTPATGRIKLWHWEDGEWK
jgi:type IV fimbrial biogenesis protein FimT